MSQSATHTTDDRTEATPSTDDTDDVDRAALVAENDRLRREIAEANRSRHRTTIFALLGVGIVSVLGGIVLPTAQTVLFALGATGIFGAILTYSITPDRFLSAAVGERVFRPLAADRETLVSELGLSDDRRYVPTDDPETPVRLFVPRSRSTETPGADALSELFIVDETAAGVSLKPSGVELLSVLERSAPSGGLSGPRSAGVVCADALVAEFELVTDVETDDEPGRVTVEMAGVEYGPIEQFDHPIVSVLACAVATAASKPVRTTVVTDADGRADAIVTCQWETE